MLRQYVHGALVDDPLICYEVANVSTAARCHLHADHQGGIFAVSDGNGAALAINSYDDYGIPASGNLGRFGYNRGTRPSGGRASRETQTWRPEVGFARLLPPPGGIRCSVIITWTRASFCGCKNMLLSRF